MSLKENIQAILDDAGVDVILDGDRSWDPKILDAKVYSKILSDGSLGLGETYMDGLWDAEEVDEFIYRMLKGHLEEKFRTPKMVASILLSKLFNFQTKGRALEVGQKHYDVGNDLYKAMLDKRMVYTCGYWKDAVTLDEAQDAKLDLVCKKIGLKKGDKVLDIGGGWASFARFASEKYGAETTAITISREQAKLGIESTKGMPIEIRVQDYRDLPENEQYDHVVSIGMFEHVGYKNYSDFMRVVARVLKDEGLFLLHTIGSTTSITRGEAWLDKYIFPNGMLPSVAQIGKAIEGNFVMEDWHNFSVHYDRTLMEWFKNFDEAWPTLKEHYDERFYRMWKYYLMISAATFRSRHSQLWQIVLSKDGVQDGYNSLR